MSAAWWWALTFSTLVLCWFVLWLLRAWEAWSLESRKRTLGADSRQVPVAVPAPEPETAPSFADSALAPAAKFDPNTAVSPGLMRLLQPVTPLDFPPGDPLAAVGPTPTRGGAVITPEAVATANSAIVYRCEHAGMVATPLACYLLGFYKGVEDLRKPRKDTPGYVVHVSMGLNPEIVAVFPQEKK